MASPKPTSASAIISALKEYGIEFTPAREKALLKTINTLFKTKSSEEVSTYVATKVAFITKQLKAIGLDTGLGDADGNGKISATELAALKAEIKGSVKTAADTGVGPGDGTTNPTTLSITGDKTSATEGKDTVTYTVKGTAGAVYTWTVDDNHVNDIVTAAGTVTIGANGEGTFTVVAKQDNLTESAEVVKVTLLDNNAAAVANANLIIQEDPGAAAALDVDTTSITEGKAGAVFTVTGLAGATYTWTIDGSHVADVETAGNVVTIGTDGKATFTVLARQDNTAEAAEVVNVSLLDGSGVVVASKLLTVLEDPEVGATFALTASADTIVGTAGNDTVNGSIADSFSAFDSIDGGAGTGDTLTVFTDANAVPGGITIKNVETLNINNSKVGGYTVDTTAYTGLTALTLVDAAVGDISVTGATTTAAKISTTGASAVTVKGTGGALSVNTGAAAVSIGGTGVGGSGTPDDVINALTSVSVVGGTTVSIHDNETSTGNDGSTLTTVSLDGNTDNALIVARGLTAINAKDLVTSGKTVTNADINSAHTLALKLDGVDVAADEDLTAGTISFVDIEATSVAITASGAASYDVALTADKATAITIAADEALQLDALTAALAATVAISGDSDVTVSAHTLTSTAAITSTSTGDVTFTGDLLAGQSYAGGAGVDTITLATAAGTKAITTGAGDDVITYGGPLAAGGSIDAGADTDTLVLTAAQAATATATATFAGTISNFEVLSVGATVAVTAIDLANADGINKVIYAGTAATKALSISHAAADFTLTQTALNADDVTVTLASDVGTNDNVNLVYKAADGFDNGLTTLTIGNVENLHITTVDSSAALVAAHQFKADIVADQVKSVVISGDIGINLTGLLGGAITSLDASGLSLATADSAFGGLTWTSGALAANATVKGSAVGTNVVDFSATVAGKVVTYTGGEGSDTINWATSNTSANIINLGNGDNTVNGGTNAKGDNTITAGDGHNIIAVGNGINTITAGTGLNTITLGTGANVVTIASDTDDNDTITFGTPLTANNYATVTGLAKGDTLDFGNQGTEIWFGIGGTVTSAHITLDASTALFADYIAASTAGTGAVNGVFSWFQFGGNTYVVEDKSAGAAFVPATDIVVKLTGLVDLAATGNLATLGDHAITLG